MGQEVLVVVMVVGAMRVLNGECRRPLGTEDGVWSWCGGVVDPDVPCLPYRLPDGADGPPLVL